MEITNNRDITRYVLFFVGILVGFRIVFNQVIQKSISSTKIAEFGS
ncbi:hypothetical protein JXJ21_22620 [candidate division KSB1 bacterium]|nr:hypothetical protein [candidate division KSB1 bacterium]